MEKESHPAEILDLDLGVATDETSFDSLGEWGECVSVVHGIGTLCKGAFLKLQV